MGNATVRLEWIIRSVRKKEKKNKTKIKGRRGPGLVAGPGGLVQEEDRTPQQAFL